MWLTGSFWPWHWYPLFIFLLFLHFVRSVSVFFFANKDIFRLEKKRAHIIGRVYWSWTKKKQKNFFFLRKPSFLCQACCPCIFLAFFFSFKQAKKKNFLVCLLVCLTPIAAYIHTVYTRIWERDSKKRDSLSNTSADLLKYKDNNYSSQVYNTFSICRSFR